LRRTRRAALDTRATVVRSLLAAALALCVLLSAVPLTALSAGGGCPMPCCRGAGEGHGGCADGSCHVSFAEHAEPAAPSKPVAPARPAGPSEDDPVCGATAAPPPQAQAATRAHHQPPAPDTAHDHSGHDSVEQSEAAEAVEQPSHQHHSARHDHQHDSTHHGAGPRLTTAAVSKPCAPDCSAPANSFTRLRRTGEAAALSFKLRPRPPSCVGRAREDARHTFDSSAWRRPCRPRGPPNSSC
jgi:hypothetical protein